MLCPYVCAQDYASCSCTDESNLELDDDVDSSTIPDRSLYSLIVNNFFFGVGAVATNQDHELLHCFGCNATKKEAQRLELGHWTVIPKIETLHSTI